ncbi:hypothetical protein BDZ91DRAFT_764580 [Kalaharituber pfeilii]|nr:hypothetical protein BDZ91DRAFT_764580 [Kalaharituber pfeilii]
MRERRSRGGKNSKLRDASRRDLYELPLPKDVRDTLEDEDVACSKELVIENPIRCLIKWLGLLVQWTEAINELLRPLTSKVRVSFLTITPSRGANVQASLDEVLFYALDDREDINIVKHKIQLEARRRVILEGAVDWSQLTKEQWDAWGAMFRGKMHCESILACLRELQYDLIKEVVPPEKRKEFRVLLEELKKTRNLLGVSKGCCYLCNQYLQEVGRVKVKSTTGKIFPWSIPEWEANPAIYNSLWQHLKQLVRSALENQGLLLIDRRLSGSDDGQYFDFAYKGQCLRR